MREANLKGAVAEAEIAVAALKLGIPVYRPVAEHGRADLVLQIRDQLLRVQCKWGTLDRDAGVIKVNLQTSYLSAAGYVIGSYSTDEIDAVAVYCGETDRCYLLPGELIAGRRAIYLRCVTPANGQRACINLAARFEFPGAVAQLEERHTGSVEARGSSPLSSTNNSEVEGPSHDVAANRFRNHFGYYMERAAAGEEVLVRRHGRPSVRLTAA